ncbi:MAG: MarR family transcriptional regulator [Sulfobacillus thermosulfidooxidans]|nr:MAG: MarR family transcriptional regulator [Sulfobacillus thermosulfidooxidans]
MPISDNPISQQLFEAFMRVRKLNWLNWHGTGPRPSDARALFCIKKDSPGDGSGIPVSAISTQLRVSTPTVTQLINEMEERGLVERHIDQEDRRVIRVRLTSHGEEAYIQARQAVSDAFDGLIDYLGPEQSTTLAHLLGQVLAYYHEHQSLPTGGAH